METDSRDIDLTPDTNNKRTSHNTKSDGSVMVKSRDQKMSEPNVLSKYMLTFVLGMGEVM